MSSAHYSSLEGFTSARLEAAGQALKKGVNFQNLFNAFGPMVFDYLFRNEKGEDDKGEDPEVKLGKLKQKVGPKAPFLMAEKPSEEPAKEASRPLRRNYKPEDLQRVVRRNSDMPPPLPEKDRDVPIMGGKTALDYYRQLCGQGEAAQEWLMRQEFRVFGTKVFHPNIILACLLKELEYRCQQLGMSDLKFDYITTTNVSKMGPHSLGLAVDFDPSHNRLAGVQEGTWDLPLAFKEELERIGFKWGGYFYSSRSDHKADPMHFQLQTDLSSALGQLTCPEAKAMAEVFKVPRQNVSLWAYAEKLKSQLPTHVG